IKQPGFYHAMRTTGITNSPQPAWFDLTVNADSQYNGTQILQDTEHNEIYSRTWHNGNTFTEWKRLANVDDVNARLPLSGGNMNKGAFINWNGGGIN
ncbi:pyocin knob domain-containing protein, partial [Limosilactobacillus reuteri]